MLCTESQESVNPLTRESKSAKESFAPESLRISLPTARTAVINPVMDAATDKGSIRKHNLHPDGRSLQA
jgi:hypothetical protein